MSLIYSKRKNKSHKLDIFKLVELFLSIEYTLLNLINYFEHSGLHMTVSLHTQPRPKHCLLQLGFHLETRRQGLGLHEVNTASETMKNTTLLLLCYYYV